MSNLPTVRLRDLVPDSCNYKDKAFEQYVHTWMRRMMPSIPLGMLDTESEIAIERWQIEPDAVHEVEKHTHVGLECSECGETWLEDGEECCYDDEDKPILINRTERTCFVVYNSNTSEFLSSQGYIRHEQLCEDYSDVNVDGESCLGWDDEGDAEKAAEEADSAYHNEHFHENSYGFPWANGTAFIPDNWVSTASLKAAGFRVATYIGGKGHWRDDEEFRVAGIDGGGYSFSGQHYARLVAYHHEEKKSTVETDHGDAYITTDYRSDLERLAEDGQKEAV
jgi:hypothetical protein